MISRRIFLTGLSAMALAGCDSGDGGNGGVVRKEIREAGLVGTLFLPANPQNLPAVVCLTGAGGGLWEDPARALAEAGFPALALATHNFEGRPAFLRLLPLDYIEQAVDWLRTRARPKNGIVALRAWSRGGEAALLLASLTSSVNAVIAYAPRCYVGRQDNKPNSFDDPAAAAAWTYRGQPIAGEPLPRAMLQDPARQSFEDKFGIAVERIKGPVMLVSGLADTGLSGTTATFSSDHAMRRLNLFNFPYPHIHYSYPDAGHTIAAPPPFVGPVEAGGSLAGDSAAIADSWPRSLAFLRALVAAQPQTS
jgi:dienelactone hydrolase